MNLIDLHRVVAVVDDSTDFAALQATLDRASVLAGETSPIRQGGSAELGVVHVRRTGDQDPRAMLAAVFGAASVQLGCDQVPETDQRLTPSGPVTGIDHGQIRPAVTSWW